MGLFSSKKKKVNQVAKLICDTKDISSYKCIFLASYRKLPIEVSWQDSSVADDKLSESLHMAGCNQSPCIEENDLKVCGASAVLTFLNIKGTAPTIHPRKARVLAAQNYWIQVLLQKFEPLLSDVKSNSDSISKVLKVLDYELDSNNHIVGEFSLADIHWSAVVKFLEERGENYIFHDYENISNWLRNIKSEIPAYETKAEEQAA